MTLTELEQYFTTTDLPQTIQLDQATTINNVRQFVDTCLLRAKSFGLEVERSPDFWRLEQLHTLLQ